MTIDEYLGLPKVPGRVRALVEGRVYERPERSKDRRTRAAVGRLAGLLGGDGRVVAQADRVLRNEPDNLFPVELAVAAADGSIPLVVIIPRAAETYGETSGKIKACLAAGVEQVWLLEFYADEVRVHRRNGPAAYVRGDEALPPVPQLPTVTPSEIYRGLPEPESALPEGLEDVWVDLLREKHECFGVRHTAALDIAAGGRRAQLVVPNHLSEVEVLTAVEHGDLLFALGRGGESFDDRPFGVIMAGRRHESGVYLVHV